MAEAAASLVEALLDLALAFSWPLVRLLAMRQILASEVVVQVVSSAEAHQQALVKIVEVTLALLWRQLQLLLLSA